MVLTHFPLLIGQYRESYVCVHLQSLLGLTVPSQKTLIVLVILVDGFDKLLVSCLGFYFETPNRFGLSKLFGPLFGFWPIKKNVWVPHCLHQRTPIPHLAQCLCWN